MSFKDEILNTQKEMKEIYALEIEKFGGIHIWEKIVGNDEDSEKKR